MADADMKAKGQVAGRIILEKLGAEDDTPVKKWVFDLKHDEAVTNIQIHKSKADAIADNPPLLEADGMVDERDVASVLFRDPRYSNGGDLLRVESFPAFTGGGIAAHFGESISVYVLPDTGNLVLEVRGEPPRVIRAPELS